MRKTLFTLVALGALVFTFVSCEKDQITPLDTQTTTIDYTVLVVDATNTLKAAEGLEGATVTISVGGKEKTATTKSSGIASFTGVKPGIIAVSVEADGYMDISYLASVKVTDEDDYNNVEARSAASKVKMISESSTATIMGEVTYDHSDTASGDAAASGVEIIVRPTTYGTLVTDVGSTDGAVSAIDLTYNISTVVSGSDGSYSVTVPTYAGSVTYTLTPQPYSGTRYDAVEDGMEDAIFSSAAKTATVLPGGSAYVDFFMND